jgi:hypothetical protein
MTLLRGAARALPILCLLVAAAILAPAAGAAPAWTPPAELSAPGQTAYEQHVAIDPQGDAVVVWQRWNGTVSVIQAATRPAGGAWSAPVDLSELAFSGQLPRVAIDAEGEAVATWEASSSVNAVQVATLAPGGGWSAPVTLSEPGRNSSDPVVAIDPAGDAIVVWSGANGAGTGIAQEATRPAGGTWTAPVKLSAEGQNAELPTVAIAPGGAAVVAWSRSNGTNFIVQASGRAPGGAWTAPLSLSKPGGGAGSSSVAIDPAGDAVVAWRRWNGSFEQIQAVRRTGEAGPWSTPVDLTRPEETAYGTVAMLDAAGDATVGWESLYGTSRLIAVAESGAGSTVWSGPTVLSGPAPGFEPTLAVDPRGDAVAAWTERSSGNEVVRTARREAGSSAWGTPVDLSPSGIENKAASIAIDPWGDAVTAWRHWDGAHSIVDAATVELPRPPAEPATEAPAPAGSGPSSAVVPPPPVTKRPPVKARCPRGKVLRKVKLPAKRAAGAKGKRKARTVLRCVKPGVPHHAKQTKHPTKHHVKGK